MCHVHVYGVTGFVDPSCLHAPARTNYVTPSKVRAWRAFLRGRWGAVFYQALGFGGQWGGGPLYTGRPVSVCLGVSTGNRGSLEKVLARMLWALGRFGRGGGRGSHKGPSLERKAGRPGLVCSNTPTLRGSADFGPMGRPNANSVKGAISMGCKWQTK